MRELNLRVNAKKRFIPQTTDSNHDGPIAPRVFKSEEPLPQGFNQVWAGDITYIKLRKNLFYYLSVVLDLFNREVIGWSIDKTLKAEGVIRALKNAITTQRSDTKVVYHSDRGSQYASDKFRVLLSEEEFIPSMSRKGNCYDNCYVESFFSSLKSDIHNMGIALTEDNIQSKLFWLIEVWYNRHRQHSSLDYISPLDFRLKHTTA